MVRGPRPPRSARDQLFDRGLAPGRALAAEVLLGDAVRGVRGHVVGDWMSSCRNDPTAAVSSPIRRWRTVLDPGAIAVRARSRLTKAGSLPTASRQRPRTGLPSSSPAQTTL